ncbi:twin transmembrane helix small protein [Sulfuricella sp.]|uniref:twin transmembrane helix small protein n=1 Tax=Sulfuricella sp. TaxID=2099377 RepID=UPI002C25890C|nr:twin transmembrane helix small protein [Sulfuricella sp.]HUX62491.1 twin transmembrane helix small protein [Sulfuricella sp.]
MLIKTGIIILLVLIIASLFSALTFLYKDKGQGERTARALTIRISLSILLFVLLMLGFYFGVIPERGL